MKSEVQEKIASRFISLDQTELGLTIEKEEIERYFEPLASWILTRAGEDRRTLVALAGPPGSGKSAFAAILKVVIDSIQGEECSLVIGQDGWHYPNEYLQKTNILRNGDTIPLKQIKGAPETFDVSAILGLLGEIQNHDEVEFPIYSRVSHDPIPAAGIIRRQHRILILEGNYLLLDAERWRSLVPSFDIKIFIDAEDEILERCLLERHMRGGKSHETARNHVQRVDLRNAGFVKQHVCEYDVHVVKKNCIQIARLDFLSNATIDQQS